MTAPAALATSGHLEVREAIETALGEPRNPDNAAGFAALAAADRADRFPTDAVAILDALGLAEHYVPAAYGGRLTDYLELAQVIRTLARRSVTVAVAHAKTFLGAATAWIGATEDQRARVADMVRAGVPISWGLTEQAHGSDLLAGDVALDGDALSGAKWLINNATRGGAVMTLARTSPAGGARGFDLVLVDKAAAAARGAASAYRHLPKELTMGIRGADISGIEFTGLPIAADDVLSEPGRGVENVMKALQLTRSICCGLSLGAADRALHIAVSFALGRQLYGRNLIDLPQARRVLADALADHVLNDAMTTAVIRSVHTLPGELSVHAAAAKYLVPTRTEKLLAALRSFVGARAVLDTDDPAVPSLSRVERDHRIVSLFDGNTVVNLTTLIAQFPLLARAELTVDSATLVATAPDADLGRLSLLSKTGSTLLRSLDGAVVQLAESGLPTETIAAAKTLATATRDLLRRAKEAGRDPANVPDANFVLAERLAAAIGGAAAIHVYLGFAATAGSPLTESPLWRDGLWLRLALIRVVAAIDPEAPSTGDAADHDEAVAALIDLHDADRGFDLLDSGAGGRA